VKLSWDGFSLDFSVKTHIMGVLNVTPDSFSDGGIHFDKERAVERALRMADEGADIIDIGGESTRPGSDPVSLEEELARTIPVIGTLAAKVKVPLSIDTYKAAVAERALDAGAAIVNDISGLRFDAAMAGLVAKRDVPVVVMHIKGSPKDMQVSPTYDALIPEIIAYLRESLRLASEAGVRDEMVIVDPGIGFGKTFDQNLEILNRLEEFRALERPILVGPSRKAFIGKILNDAPAGERLEGTAAAVAVSVMKGANIVRVHDVREMARVARVTDAIRRERIA
jgi:dihydropteroate synthase